MMVATYIGLGGLGMVLAWSIYLRRLRRHPEYLRGISDGIKDRDGGRTWCPGSYATRLYNKGYETGILG